MDLVAGNDGTSQTLLVSENTTMRGTTQRVSWLVADEEFDSSFVWFPRSTNPSSQGFRGSANFVHTPDHFQARPASVHPGVFVSVFCDGATRVIDQAIEYEVYALLMTHKGRDAALSSNCVARDRTGLGFQSSRVLSDGDY